MSARCRTCRQPIDAEHSHYVLERGGRNAAGNGRPADRHYCSLDCLALEADR